MRIRFFIKRFEQDKDQDQDKKKDKSKDKDQYHHKNLLPNKRKLKRNSPKDLDKNQPKIKDGLQEVVNDL